MSVALCRGPDVSNWSGYPNWSAAKRSGMMLAGAKATEGTYFRDSTFPFNWPRMSSNGLLRIAYHFAQANSGSNPIEQADYFCNYVQQCGGWRRWDIPCLDIESGDLTGGALSWWIDQWCRRVEQRWGRPGFIYSGNWYIGDRGADCSRAQARGWKLWPSVYGPSPFAFSGFHDWELWQHTDGLHGPDPHSCAGVGQCDMNIWNGNSDRMWAFAHVSEPRPLPQHNLGSRFINDGMTGTDVAQLQADLNHRLTARRKQNISTDGLYGPKTENAKHWVEYMLGFPFDEVKRHGCSEPDQLTIHDPSKRPAKWRVVAALRGDPTPRH